MPVFVKVSEYDDVLALVRTIRNKLDEAKDTLMKVGELKNEEDHQIEQWTTTLGEIEKKVDFISHSLSDPQQYHG